MAATETAARTMSGAFAATKATIRGDDIIVLSMRDSIALAEALLDPRGLNEALREAVRLHRHMFGPTEGA